MEAKFELGDMMGIGMTVVVAGIGISYGLQVLGSVRDDMITGEAGCTTTNQTGCSEEYTAAVNGIEGVGI